MFVYLFRNVPGLKWRFLSNVLVHVGKTGKTAVNWNNSRPWIGLCQGAKCDNVPVVAVTPFSPFHILLLLLLLLILPTEFLHASSA